MNKLPRVPRWWRRLTANYPSDESKPPMRLADVPVAWVVLALVVLVLVALAWSQQA